MSLWIVAAVENELSLLLEATGARFEGALGEAKWFAGGIGDRSVSLGITGVGVTSAAMALGVFGAKTAPDFMVMVGSAGALPGSGLQTGDMVVSQTEILAELGVSVGTGIGNAQNMTLPGVRQEVDLDQELSSLLLGHAVKIGNAVMGRSLTVLGVSGSEARARERAVHFQALAENMEGYALALAGKGFPCRTAEIRGVSNRAGDRDKRRWDFEKGTLSPQKVVLEYLRKKIEKAKNRLFNMSQ
jgi:futalosine hydrolase